MIEGNANATKMTSITALVYGDPGSGKTHLISTAPKPYVIISERQPNTLISTGKDIPYVIVETWEDAQLVVDEIAQGIRAADAETIALDSATDLTPLVVDYVQRTQNKKKMDISCWGLAVDYLRTFIWKISHQIGKQKHVLVTARASIEKDDISGQIAGWPDTIGKFRQSLAAHFDLAFYCEQGFDYVTKQAKFEMHTIAKGYYKAKGGLGITDPVMPNDFSVIVSRWNDRYNTTK